mmetsp:Transcript_5927/g.17828  ORF Transcript_5927/g.17828 Transcript_5927/m.17828 type:complete len:221 (-) Transcript_5927:90-752(-)
MEAHILRQSAPSTPQALPARHLSTTAPSSRLCTFQGVAYVRARRPRPRTTAHLYFRSAFAIPDMTACTPSLPRQRTFGRESGVGCQLSCRRKAPAPPLRTGPSLFRTPSKHLVCPAPRVWRRSPHLQDEIRYRMAPTAPAAPTTALRGPCPAGVACRRAACARCHGTHTDRSPSAETPTCPLHSSSATACGSTRPIPRPEAAPGVSCRIRRASTAAATTR